MASAPSQPVEVPPYQLQPLIASVVEPGGPFSLTVSGAPNQVRCAQALGSEIYVGCSNGELMRYALQGGPRGSQSYTLLSRQTLPNEKAIDEIVLAPSIARVLILSGRMVYFYTLPSLDPVPPNIIQPIRNVAAFVVDELHARRPPISSGEPSQAGVEPIDFCILKRGSIVFYQLRERLLFLKDMSFPPGVTLARRAGRYLCIADQEVYNVIDLESASLIPVLPISQAPDTTVRVRPFIVVVGESEFLILSWSGSTTLGVFINGNGDPVRGTLEWPSHPQAVALDYPYITTLLANETIEIHNVEDQSIVQVLSAPPTPGSPVAGLPPQIERTALVACLNRYMVPSVQATEKMRMTKVQLVRGSAADPRAADTRRAEENGLGTLPVVAI